MMLWLVILLPTMAAKCAWMPFPVKEERRAVERHWFWEKSDIFPFFSPLPLLHFSTHSLWNSNLGMTNRVITSSIDVASFDLQMCNLDIWLVRIKVSGTMEKQIWGSSRSQKPHTERDVNTKTRHTGLPFNQGREFYHMKSGRRSKEVQKLVCSQQL